MSRSSIYESTFKRLGISYTYLEKVDLDSIDIAKSLRNQARLEQPLDQNLVEQYRLAKRDNADFPGLVLYRPGRGKAVAIDGNHRLAAYEEAGIGATDAYMIHTTDLMLIDRLTWTWNNLVNGKRLTYDECFQHALTFVEKYGYTTTQAAQEWSVKKWELDRALRVRKLREVLAQNNIKMTKSLTDDKLIDLSPLRATGDDVFCEAARVTSSSGISTDDVKELVKEVKDASTSQGKLKVVADFANRPKVIAKMAETKGGQIKRQTPLPREKMVDLLRQMSRLFENFPSKAALQPLASSFDETRPIAEDVVDKLVEVYGLGSKLRRKEA